MEWSAELIALFALQIAVVGFLWSLHRDMANIRERMAKLEGVVETLRDTIVGKQVQQHPAGPRRPARWRATLRASSPTPQRMPDLRHVIQLRPAK